jgi:hypothetical protein
MIGKVNKMDKEEIKLKAEWLKYVESYNPGSSKKMHLLSCTHVVFKLIEKATTKSKTKSEQAYDNGKESLKRLRQRN